MPSHSPLLIVDDNAATLYSMRRVLERHGYPVKEAGTGAEGLALLASEAFAALILDVNLPDMSGFDIVRHLRSEAGTRLLPVIHVSAASIETGDLITGLDAGADAYLIHPVDPDVLLATLRTLLRVRSAEDALTESEARFREIFSSTVAPIAVVDQRLAIHEANAAFARLLYGAENEGSLLASFESGQEDALEQLRTHLAERKRWRGTVSMRVRDAVRRIEWRVAPYRAPDLGLVFVEDVTEQWRREQRHEAALASVNTQLAQEIAERERTESQLHQAMKMDALGKLTGGIAHDFNNLLTTIITGIDLMSRHVSEGRIEGVQRFADMALGSARRAVSLTHRLLAFARQQPLDPKPVDINQLLRSLNDLLRRTIGEHIALRFELMDDIGIAKVDANQLENAIINLVINARDAMPNGGEIRVLTSTTRLHGDGELPDGRYVQVAVIDNGSGIEPDVLERVFEPFFSTKPMGKGTGLGLSMIYGFSRQSGGRVTICSQKGVGTEVRLTLPQGEPEHEEELEESADWAQGQGESVLIVEDNTSLRALARELLSDAGYRCIEAEDVDAALRVLRGDVAIHLLLTDVGLPGMNGRQLAEAARAWRPSLPILFMTGYAESALAGDELLDEGMDILIKPFEIDQLLTKVRGMLD
ncbi:response regulator [Dyella sp. C11]|uniref:response regulator n=1 Tax=Dyella sp. C11 TaxID=2126991 RepID=UPI000D64A47B|nr:response regulator [Dyella sp. C11]